MCWSGGYGKLFSGGFDIYGDGHYTGVENRSGKFIYDQPKKTIVFKSGDFEYWDFIAVYQTAAESNNGRERLVLKDESWESPIGQENPGDYQYCYLDNTPRTIALGRDGEAIENQALLRGLASRLFLLAKNK